MKSFDLHRYLVYAFRIIRSTPVVLWLLALAGAANAATFLLGARPLNGPVSVLAVLLSIVITPVIYGIYYQLIEDTYTSIPAIARTYLLPYLWLLIRMYVPVILAVSFMLPALPGNGSGYLEITLILFSLLYLYVIPVYYRTGTQRGAISSGVNILLETLVPTTPLLLAMMLVEASMLLFQYVRPQLLEAYPIGSLLCEFVIYYLGSLIDFAIFIILIYILKREAGRAGENGD